MTDISKCNGDGCPLSLMSTCRRYTAPCGNYQSWISPESTVGGECPNYLPVFAFAALTPPARDEGGTR